MPYQVAVCGPRHCTIEDRANACSIGQLLAERGAVVICGGGIGVMAAVAAGVRSKDGLVVGIRPNDTREGASPDLSVTLVTNMGEARNAIIVWSADAVIVVGGSWGTLSEVALAQRRGGVPVISLGGWRILDQDGQQVSGIEHVKTPEEAVEKALAGRLTSTTTESRCVSVPAGHGHDHGHALDPTAAGPDPHVPSGLASRAGRASRAGPAGRAVRIGIGGPVGCGKTALVAALTRTLAPQLRLAVVTNDIYTTEDADFLRQAGVLTPDRIEAVQTGCCPHTAIRDDITANLDAVELLEERFGDLDLVLLESGGDNLTAVFSRGLVDRQIFVVDVAGGDKVPRKGGPGVTTADLLVINKVDLAPLVGADMAVMISDAHRVRGGLPVITQSLVTDPTATEVAEWVAAQVDAVQRQQGGFADGAPGASTRPAG